MKIFFLLFLSTLSIDCIAQSKVTNTIGTVKELNIYGKPNIIISKIIVNQTLHTKILYANQSIIKDTAGFYLTTYKFVPVDNPGIFKVEIAMSFDKPFVAIPNSIQPFTWDCTNNIVSYLVPNWTANFMKLTVKGTISADDLKITVRSTQPLIPQIYGVDGKLN